MEKSESSVKLSDEFKKDLRKKSEVNWPAISGLLILIFIIFSALILGTYQIFYKPEKVESTTVSSQEKIQSRPEAEAEKVEQKTATPTPAVATPKPTPAVTTPATPETYTVVEGDTLSGIAAKYGTTSKAIADYNGFTDAEATLNIGQKIKIPK